jgi:hypothetical protein
MGQIFLMTADGLYVGELFQDCRSAPESLPAAVTRGVSLNNTSGVSQAILSNNPQTWTATAGVFALTYTGTSSLNMGTGAITTTATSANTITGTHTGINSVSKTAATNNAGMVITRR